MSNGNAFAKEFVDLLRKSNFPTNLPAADMLQQTHTMLYALLTAVAGKFGQRFDISDLMQGPRGGGGPHRLDLVFHYLTAVDSKTMETTLEIVGQQR
jgi:hypothetical protein